MNKNKILLGIIATALLIPLGVNAQTVADVANTVKSSISGIPQFIGVICYIAGIAFGVIAGLKLKEFSESKGQVRISAPIIWASASFLLLAMPTLMDVGMSTFGYKKTTRYTNNSKY